MVIAVADLDQHDTYSVDNGSYYTRGKVRPGRAFLSRIQERGALCSAPTLLSALSQVSRAFRRLVLPYLCHDVVVQTADSDSESETDSLMEKLKSMPYPQLVR